MKQIIHLRFFQFLPRSLLMVLAILASVFVAACADDDDGPKYIERPVNNIYDSALNSLTKGEYKFAAQEFDEVERQHPYSTWAVRAKLMAAYANYLDNQYDSAIVALDRFIQLHPSNKDVPYAYYLKGLSYYEQISNVTRDQQMTELAMRSLRELVSRFPNSKYARDAKLKIELTLDHLAGKDMSIGRYYLKQRKYLAAINRFKKIVDRYQSTTHVPEALHRLVEAYLALGIVSEAKKMAAVLGHNYPGSEWYIDSFEMVGNQRFRPEVSPWYKFW
jgi:outer membrane protein assembly factor BamD